MPATLTKAYTRVCFKSSAAAKLGYGVRFYSMLGRRQLLYTELSGILYFCILYNFIYYIQMHISNYSYRPIYILRLWILLAALGYCYSRPPICWRIYGWGEPIAPGTLGYEGNF